YLGLVAGWTWSIAIYMRPSWALFPLLAHFAIILIPSRVPRLVRLVEVLLVLVGLALTLSPWWYRNLTKYGCFCPTVPWSGARLYDGLNPRATGASDMRFLGDPQFRNLDELTQDRLLRDEAIAFARANPLRTLQLAAIKAARFCSPWPNSDELKSLWARIGS